MVTSPEYSYLYIPVVTEEAAVVQRVKSVQCGLEWMISEPESKMSICGTGLSQKFAWYRVTNAWLWSNLVVTELESYTGLKLSVCRNLFMAAELFVTVSMF